MSELARLAIGDQLPAACLGLLNVLLVAHKRFDAEARQKVEVPVRGILKSRSEAIKVKLKKQDKERFENDERALRKAVAEELAPWIGLFAAAMLYDGRHWQLLGPTEEAECTTALFWLSTKLRSLAAGVCRAERVLDELDLWSHPRDLLVEAGKQEKPGVRSGWSEAMSLLYAHDVPDVPDEPAGGWDPEKERLEQARRAYQDAYKDLEAGRYEAAKAGLKELRKIAGEDDPDEDEPDEGEPDEDERDEDERSPGQGNAEGGDHG
jgi:hypothetical protein